MTTQASVVLWRSGGIPAGASAAAIISTLRSISPSAPRGPAISPPAASRTSPVALTAAMTATVSPAPVVAAA